MKEPLLEPSSTCGSLSKACRKQRGKERGS